MFPTILCPRSENSSPSGKAKKKPSLFPAPDKRANKAMFRASGQDTPSCPDPAEGTQLHLNDGALETHPAYGHPSHLVRFPCGERRRRGETESPRYHGLHHHRCEVVSIAD